MNVFIRLLIAHVLGDFLLNQFASSKRSGNRFDRWKTLVFHTGIILLTTLLLMIDLLNLKVFYFCILIAVSHMMIDFTRLVLEYYVSGSSKQSPIYSKKENLYRLFYFLTHFNKGWSSRPYRNWFLLNLFDQCLHIMILSIVAFLITVNKII